jgi:hypothetical protein
MTSSILEFALRYGEKKIKVFPVHGIVDRRCTCGKDCGKQAGKHPIYKGGFHGATDDQAQIRRWWARHSNANIGVPTGKGLVIIDIDGDEGLESLHALIEQRGKFSRTLYSSTGRGHHLYLKTKPDVVIPCSSGNGLDVRGDGGYAIAPPSVHASGCIYAWHDRNGKRIDTAESWDPLEIAECSDAFVDWATSRTNSGRSDDKFDPQSRHSRQSLPPSDIEAAVALLPNPDLSWDDWNKTLMLLWAASDGAALPAAHQFSKKSRKYDPAYTDKRWQEVTKSPPTQMSVRSLIYKVKQFKLNWIPPSQRNGAEDGELTQREKLISIGLEAVLWHDKDGNIFATVTVDEHKENFAIKSTGFRHWLTREYGERYPMEVSGQSCPSAPSAQALTEALNALSAKAASGSEHQPAIRVATEGGSIYLDLGTSDWSIVEISPDGWRIVQMAPVRFIRSRGFRSLPIPVRGGSIASFLSRMQMISSSFLHGYSPHCAPQGRTLF